MIDSIPRGPCVVIYVDLLQLLRKPLIEIKLKNVDDYKEVTSVLFCFAFVCFFPQKPKLCVDSLCVNHFKSMMRTFKEVLP